MTRGATDSAGIVYSPQEVGKLVVAAVEGRTRDRGLTTGLADLDRYMLPMRPGDLVTVLGNTSNYKTGLMMYIARRAAAEGARGLEGARPVAYCTWEQAIEEHGLIEIAGAVGLDVTAMMRGELSPAQQALLVEGATRRALVPLWLLGHSLLMRRHQDAIRMADVALALREIESSSGAGLRLVVLDYLQRIAPAASGRSRREEQLGVVDAAKDLALRAGCPVLLGSQARREVRTRPGLHLPTIDDGQETARLEQASDIMLSVWLPKTSYELGTLLDVPGASGETRRIKVSPNVLFVRLLKQRFAPAPFTLAFHVDPAKNEIRSIEWREHVVPAAPARDSSEDWWET